MNKVEKQLKEFKKINKELELQEFEILKQRFAEVNKTLERFEDGYKLENKIYSSLIEVAKEL